jgi:shikimate dehydrogenase
LSPDTAPHPPAAAPGRATAARYAVLGHPVAHSRSPAIHAAFAAATGQALDYGRLDCPPGGFAAAVQAFAAGGAAGCNVTVPFKFEAAALVRAAGGRLSDRARLADAANTLRFDGPKPADWLADNTDGIGLVADLRHNAGLDLRGLRVLLVGAGGAAAGVLGPLLQAGPRELVLVNRTADRAAALAARHAAVAAAHGVTLTTPPLARAGTGFDLVVNASASSLQGAASPVDAAVLRPGGWAVDLMYGGAARPFLDWAVAHGAQPRDGLGMLVEQAAEAFAIWRGVRPQTAAVLASMRAEVDAAPAPAQPQAVVAGAVRGEGSAAPPTLSGAAPDAAARAAGGATAGAASGAISGTAPGSAPGATADAGAAR